MRDKSLPGGIALSTEASGLLKRLAENGGELTEVGLADKAETEEIVELGLAEAERGSGWTLTDTVRLSRHQRLIANLPPELRQPSPFTMAARSVSSAIARLLGKLASR